MSRSTIPFAPPARLEGDLKRVLVYWDGLKRAENRMPFWDDVAISALPDLAGRLMLIDVFDKPERFRMNTIGDEITECYGEAVSGVFADELAHRSPYHFLRAQCSAAVEAGSPTYYAHTGEPAQTDDRAYARLLLPMWGNGRVGMLLGGVAWR